MTNDDQEIHPNATIRQEYVQCGNPDCQNQHGPYLYTYWKQGKKLNKKYLGKNFEAFRLRQIAKEIKLKPRVLIKFKFIEQQANQGNAVAKQYLEKLRNEEISIKKLINSIRQQRMLKMMTIVDISAIKTKMTW